MGEIFSCVTFLYFKDLPAAERFFGDDLGLKPALKTGWATIWRCGEMGFLGAVDRAKASIPQEVKGGTLVSFCVSDVDFWRRKIAASAQNLNLTPIKEIEGLGLRSFFFKGPEGYDFEIQEFYGPKYRQLFLGN